MLAAMTAELTVLALSGLLQAALFALFAIPANPEPGTGHTTGPRDRPPSRSMSLTTARMQRARNNAFEAPITLAIAVVVVTLGGQSSPLTEVCAWTFLATLV